MQNKILTLALVTSMITLTSIAFAEENSSMSVEVEDTSSMCTASGYSGSSCRGDTTRGPWVKYSGCAIRCEYPQNPICMSASCAGSASCYCSG